jgi:cytochrome c oxidase assembly factor CtaG
MYDQALRSQLLYDALSFALLGVSLAFWWPIIDPGQRNQLPPMGRLFYIMVATIPQTFAGLTLMLSTRLIYRGYQTSPQFFGLTPLADQVAAGAILAILSKLALLAAFAVILVRLLHAAPADDDGGGGGHRDAPAPEPPTLPVWLDDIRRGRVIPEPEPLRRPRRGLPARAGR